MSKKAKKDFYFTPEVKTTAVENSLYQDTFLLAQKEVYSRVYI